ncbi:hypothetical protein AB837_00099 [bacterium AB1]|nr:hypothetical protein AB837_00099 [bacterium AB1]
MYNNLFDNQILEKNQKNDSNYNKSEENVYLVFLVNYLFFFMVIFLLFFLQYLYKKIFCFDKEVKNNKDIDNNENKQTK